MKALVLSFALLAAVAAPANAQPTAGTFGVGVESPLAIGPLIGGGIGARLPGLSLRYQLSDAFGLQAILSYRVGAVQNDGDDADKTSLIGTFVRAHFAAVRREVVTLGAFAGLGFINAKANPRGPGDSVSRIITIEGGLRPEVWIADRASLHLQIGLTFAIVNGDGAPVTEGFAFAFGQNADLFGVAGLTVWFGDGGSGDGGSGDGGPGDGGPGGFGEAPPPATTEPAPAPAPAAEEPPPNWESGDSGY